MKIELVRAKIHRATVTQADVDYEGSIGIDACLLKAADIFPYELVHVWNLTRGTRLTTYAIEAPSGSGEIKPNGGAALHNQVGDIVIVAAFGQLNHNDGDLHNNYKPTVVLVDKNNTLTEIKRGSLYLRR